MSSASHPISLVSELAQTLASTGSLEFSKYVYVPQSIAESRKFFSATSENLKEVFEEERQTLRPNEEIAFHSRVGRLHLPMIDMGCEDILPHIDNLRSAFSHFDIDRFSVYSSGRSFHVYGHGFLSDQHELVRFMGRILLLNLPNQERVIDERWVGHRLMAGYLTLRWTNNNPHYKQLPSFLSQF